MSIKNTHQAKTIAHVITKGITVTLFLGFMMLALTTENASAAALSITDTPLFLTAGAPPLNLLVMGRDHKLYYEAYDDHSDLTGDGTIDTTYKPDTIDYYGYFDSHKCYTYGSGQFTASSMAGGSNGKQCPASTAWSGDWLNYVTTSRMDAIRKVLYGGKRSTDAVGSTVLERSFIPQDSHSWAKAYSNTTSINNPVTENGYDIRLYTTLPLPNLGYSHLFGNTTPVGTTLPLLRIITNQRYGDGSALNPYAPLPPWNWAAIERVPVGQVSTQVVTGITSGGAEVRTTVSPTDMTVRVKACDTSFGVANLEPSCRAYTNSSTGVVTYKPAGILQSFGENNSMDFGLLTGSYANNLNGGVLRKIVSSFTNEVSLNDGTFTSGANGIVQTINNLTVTNFGNYNGQNFSYSCGWIDTRAINNGECQMWGNPIGEMMYEGLRYFAGKSSATSAFQITAGQGEESGLNLPVATWSDPYKTFGKCAKPVETVISDIDNSYDSDSLPGVDSNFGSFTGDMAGLNVSTLAQTIWNNEFGAGTSKQVFIGQVGAAVTGPLANAPTAKTVTTFGNIRGLAPDEPSKQGSYYAASVALYGHNTDLNPVATTQSLDTFVVALASPLPKIVIPVGSGIVTLIPYARTINGQAGSFCSQSPGGVGAYNVGPTPSGSFQATDQIVKLYVATLTPTYGKFKISYEDQEQGSDYDMDAIVTYEYTVSGNNVAITLTSDYGQGCYTQHMGYIISGTTKDGIYLEVADQRGGDSANDYDYQLDTPPGVWAGASTGWNDGKALPAGASEIPTQPMKTTRTFTAGSSSGAVVLNPPLWYAAKYGGFNDINGNGKPDNNANGVNPEWDTSGTGTPDNYFLVTNALTLPAQMSNAFNDILKATGSASASTVNSGSVSNNARVYQAKFQSGTWLGQLLSYTINPTTGAINTVAEWDAATKLPTDQTQRNIYTVGSEATFTPKAFTWTAISTDTTRSAQLNATSTYAKCELEYLRGDATNELNAAASYCEGTPYRSRLTKLGDIVNSSPIFVGSPAFGYSDTSEGSGSKKYSAFYNTNQNRKNAVYVGANDGMVHAFDADQSGSTQGNELFAFIPSVVFGNLNKLTNINYQHQYFVDGSPTSGDVYYGNNWHTVLVGGLNKGGKEIYALNVTDPANFSASNVLWEFTDKNDVDLGYTFSQPVIVKLHSGSGTGQWAAIFGNGYDNSVNTGDGIKSTTGHAVLYVVNMQDGSLIRKIDTGVGIKTSPNGLATPAAVDIDGDGIVDYVYAGDLQGNMWKFDIRDKTPANWKVSYTSGANPAPLFVATDSAGHTQPITSRPEVIRGPFGVGMTVLFGTGKWLELIDKTVVPDHPQSFYGIYDTNTGTNTDIVSRSNLGQQTIVSQIVSATTALRTTSNNSPGTQGWYIDLIPPPSGPYVGERVVSSPIVRNGRVLFTTLIPSTDPCDYGGSSWLMDMTALNGQQPLTATLDTNGDGVINANDSTADGVLLSVGIGQTPGVLSAASSSLEYYYVAGSSGDTETLTGSGPRLGRQSWRELK